MTKTIEHKLFFPNPTEDVWEYLTKAELMQQWLMPNDFMPIMGYDFPFKTKPIPSLDLDGIFYCKVVEIFPFKKLSYSWKGGPGDRKITLDSMVEWTLLPKDDGTELSLKHTGFRAIENFSIFSGMNDGWFKNINKIYQLLNAAKDATTNT